MADEGFKVVHRYYITDQKGEINEETPFFDSINERPLLSTKFNELYVVRKKGKFGIIDLKAGKVLFDPIYEKVSKLTNSAIDCSVELVLKGTDSEFRTYHTFYRINVLDNGTIDLHMAYQLCLEEDFEISFGKGSRKNNFVLVDRENKYGLFNTETCQLVVDFLFDKIEMSSLHNGLVKVIKDFFVGYVNVETGKIQVQTKYSQISPFNESGFATVLLEDIDNPFNVELWGIVDKTGKEVVPVTQLRYRSQTIRINSVYEWEQLDEEYQQFDDTVDFVVGFDVIEKKWFLYTKTGIKIPYPIEQLSDMDRQKLTLFDDKEFTTITIADIHQIKAEPNTFIVLNASDDGFETSRQKQRFTLFKDFIIEEIFGDTGFNEYLEIPDTVRTINFDGKYI